MYTRNIKFERMSEMGKRKKNSFKVFDNEKQRWLHGNAAFLRIASNAGGADAFVKDIANKAIAKATPIIVEEVLKSYSQPKLKIVN